FKRRRERRYAGPAVAPPPSGRARSRLPLRAGSGFDRALGAASAPSAAARGAPNRPRDSGPRGWCRARGVGVARNAPSRRARLAEYRVLAEATTAELVQSRGAVADVRPRSATDALRPVPASAAVPTGVAD